MTPSCTQAPQNKTSTRNSAVIDFVGDIMCNISQNEACKTADGYDYGDVFSQVTDLLSGGDYCVGNLETPFAGENAEFSGKLYSFNTPTEFAAAVRRAGFDLVATANNHCLDREFPGLINTLEVLEQNGLDHIGTYRSHEERSRPFLRTINGIKTGFVNYTYGTNAFANHCFLKDEETFAVNLFQPQETLPGSIHLLNSAEQIAKEVEEIYRQPNPLYDSTVKPYLAQMDSDIRNCRKSGAEFIFVIMHSGGQYNPTPDAYTEYLIERIRQAGADMIIGHHPHIVHKFEYKDGAFPVAYSLGNFAFTPDQSPDSRKNPISATALILSVELEKYDGGVIVSGLRFIVTRSVTLPNGKSVVIPMFKLINETDDPDLKKTLIEDNRIIVNTFLNRDPDTPVDVEKEYSCATYA